MPPIIQINDLTMRIGDLVLFENLSLSLNETDKVGLIAINGTGKSTLLNIIAGHDSPVAGSVVIPGDLRIGYLAQEPKLDNSRTAIEEMLLVDTPEIRAVYQLVMAEKSHNERGRTKAVQMIDDLQAWHVSSRINMLLDKLKITDIDQEIGTMSGGERKRVALAKVLASDPDILILDEPTNHLDLDMIEWLEDYLSELNKPILMVTHDRYFLDRVCNLIIEMDNRSIFRYEGNYQYYVQQKEERELQNATISEKAKNLYRTELDWLRRMPKARTHKATFRVKRADEIAELAQSFKKSEKVSINAGQARLGKKILVAEKITKKLGNKRLVDNFNYTFSRGEKVGIVGKNGSGKTTLLNLLTGEINPDAGRIEWGETVKVGYYKQAGITFDEDMKVIDIARSISEVVINKNGDQVDVSQFLTRFLFPPKRQFDLVRKLSGGERQRLYLLTILMKNPNFIILDEPTNDLDIVTLNVVEEYLQDFEGCLLVVSHDRYFMDKIVDHIFEFREDGVIKDFPGNYTQLRNFHDSEEQRKEALRAIGKKKEKNSVATKPKKGLTFNEKREHTELESEINDLEKERSIIETELSTGNSTHERITELARRMEKIIDQLEEREMRWLELEEKKESGGS